MDIAIGKRGPIVQDEGFCICTAFLDLFVEPHAFPMSDALRLSLHEIGFHGEACAREIEGILQISGHGQERSLWNKGRNTVPFVLQVKGRKQRLISLVKAWEGVAFFVGDSGDGVVASSFYISIIPTCCCYRARIRHPTLVCFNAARYDRAGVPDVRW